MTGIIKTDKIQSPAGNDAVTVASNGSITTGAIASTTGSFTGAVGIGTNSPSGKLNLATGASATCELRLTANNTGSGAGDRGKITVYSARNDGTAYEAGKIEIDRSNGTEDKAHMIFATNGGSGNTERLRITSDGRGLSQFTAKAWVNFNGTGTVAIRDSHNVSSITDNGVGQYRTNFANTMTNANYSFTAISYQNIRWATQNTSFAEVINAPYYGATHTDASNVNVNVFGD